MLDVDLLPLVAGEGEPGVGDDPASDVRLELLAVEVLLRAVSGAEVVDQRADGDFLRGEVRSVLDECSEGGGPVVVFGGLSVC